ncbi:hypothetical protein HU200_002813 [Digitaria exilis]|uniref:DUF4220 domain-containing protein n=1 Tax=Digitaria exilis TaxID=1010633 RepID=A0A835KV22_9POAL|nr:hypothetical protein HU200_002813 [Digitaria exilis]
MAIRGDDSSPIRRRLKGWLGEFLVPFLAVAAGGLALFLLTARQVLSTMGLLFLKDQVTRMASVELWVVMTTLLLVVRFLLDFLGPWYTNLTMARIVVTIQMLNFTMVHYTIGQMQLSSARVNEYFQVWAVLLITLQYSVKIGRLYDRSKQIPLLDLMSSFWTANLLRVQTFLLLKIPLWLVWTLNAARIISYFSSTDKADGINQESSRMIANYMSYEHELGESSQPSDDADVNMELYHYVILGEDQLLKDVQEDHAQQLRAPIYAGQCCQQEHPRRRRRLVRFDPNGYPKLITVNKLWDADIGKSRLLGNEVPQMTSTGRGPLSFLGNFRKHGFLAFASCRPDQLKDVCLSFALYKLLCRRFYDLPLHEARLQKPREKMRRLLFKNILQERERAFRIAAIELSFLQDLFYSKHANMFANGFPTTNIVLSLMLVAAVGYIGYPIRHIPERMDQADHNRITHGVFITHVIIFLIAVKELAEVYLYVFSQWTKVLILCSYVKHRCMRQWLVETAMRVLLCFISRGTWDQKIRQHNLLIATRGVRVGPFFFMPLPSKSPTRIELDICTKEAIFRALKELGTKLDKLKTGLQKKHGTELEKKLEKELARLDFYISTGASEGPSLPSLFDKALKFEADTHKILVWHIATCLCEISLVSAKDQATETRHLFLSPRPLIKKPRGRKPVSPTSIQDDEWWEHYITATSLSNYCMYLVTEAMVPDNSIVAKNVFMEVRREINRVTLDGSIPTLLKFRSMTDVQDRLMKLLNMTDKDKQQTQADPGKSDVEAASTSTKPRKRSRQRGGNNGLDDITESLTWHGATLAKNLEHEFGKDQARLWEQLADFWTGFLLYLAASTRASKHRASLAGSRELTTHLWALLSNAGFHGSTAHGHTFLDLEERKIIQAFND